MITAVGLRARVYYIRINRERAKCDLLERVFFSSAGRIGRSAALPRKKKKKSMERLGEINWRERERERGDEKLRNDAISIINIVDYQ